MDYLTSCDTYNVLGTKSVFVELYKANIHNTLLLNSKTNLQQ